MTSEDSSPAHEVLPSKSGTSKRKRSPSTERPSSIAPPTKAAKTHASTAQINYLFRHFSDTLPMISLDDSLPGYLQLLSDYGGVLERHESLAGNLGARPLGPILIKRFERLFEGPPRVLKSHGKEGTSVTWLDVVEFARHKPEQFNLEKMRDGFRVCQIYTKQSRVEISEEDFMLISSGMPQKLIPPQPIAEDEEKELGTLEIMESMIAQVAHLADQVATRARQMNHRLKHRRHAIVTRREIEAASEAPKSKESGPAEHAITNGHVPRPESPKSGFLAVNRASALKESNGHVLSDTAKGAGTLPLPPKTFAGTSALPSTRNELLNLFHNPRADLIVPDYMPTPPAKPANPHKSKAKAHVELSDAPPTLLDASASPGPGPHTPSTQIKASSGGGGGSASGGPSERVYDDAGPYKAEMLSRMDRMGRGDRVRPPCDRCRRLHMDCLKNLTACLGCTKKHAKCSWKDVSEQELIDNPFPAPASADDEAKLGAEAGMDADGDALGPKRSATSLGVRDEELLGEELSDDAREATPLPVNGTTLNERIYTVGTVVVPMAEVAAKADAAVATSHPDPATVTTSNPCSGSTAIAASATISTTTISNVHPPTKAAEPEPMDIDGEDVDHILATAAGGQDDDDDDEDEAMAYMEYSDPQIGAVPTSGEGLLSGGSLAPEVLGGGELPVEAQTIGIKTGEMA